MALFLGSITESPNSKNGQLDLVYKSSGVETRFEPQSDVYKTLAEAANQSFITQCANKTEVANLNFKDNDVKIFSIRPQDSYVLLTENLDFIKVKP
ncbi:MAG: hypothetical protein H6605_00095 [Flavobacteriales bacterium]|nr:hypothetical protein [Flavobacteriales bacterium]